jgi:hypothetical protein
MLKTFHSHYSLSATVLTICLYAARQSFFNINTPTIHVRLYFNFVLFQRDFVFTTENLQKSKLDSLEIFHLSNIFTHLKNPEQKQTVNAETDTLISESVNK